MKVIFHLTLIVLLLILVQPIYSQKKDFSISVDVQAKDKTTQNLVESYITRELRTLGDVDIKENEPFYRMTIIVLKNKSTDGLNIGYTLSITTSYRNKCLHSVKKDGKPDTYACYVSSGHSVHIGGLGDLRSMCEEVVNEFDIETLKPTRDVFKKLGI
ncbi:MAG TPA: hypothetical protein VF644_10435 [Pyrinomonadaceae bacterium]|jgi:hypothetical protein